MVSPSERLLPTVSRRSELPSRVLVSHRSASPTELESTLLRPNQPATPSLLVHTRPPSAPRHAARKPAPPGGATAQCERGKLGIADRNGCPTGSFVGLPVLANQLPCVPSSARIPYRSIGLTHKSLQSVQRHNCNTRNAMLFAVLTMRWRQAFGAAARWFSRRVRSRERHDARQRSIPSYKPLRSTGRSFPSGPIGPGVVKVAPALPYLANAPQRRETGGRRRLAGLSGISVGRSRPERF